MQREQIDQRLAAGHDLLDIGRTFSISTKCLRRHLDNHLKPEVKEAHERCRTQEAEARGERRLRDRDSYLEELEQAGKLARNVAIRAYQGGDLRTCSRAIGEWRANIMDRARLADVLTERKPDVNIYINPSDAMAALVAELDRFAPPVRTIEADSS